MYRAMFRLLRQWFLHFSSGNSQSVAFQNRRAKQRRFWRKHSLIWLLSLMCLSGGLSLVPTLANAQSNVRQQEDSVIREFSLPRAPSQAPVYRPRQAAPRQAAPRQAAPRQAAPARPSRSNTEAPARPAPARTAPAEAPRIPDPEPQVATQPAQPTYQYVLEFNRSPVVGNRLRMEGVYPETRIGFTRPRNWQVKSAKAVIRFQHSPSLLADRSNLTVRINDTSIGSIPLNRSQSQVGQVMFNIPPNLLQDYNEVSILAEHQTSENCTNPSEPTLWTEILPDSRIVMDFQPQAIPLDFSRYPYPFLDDLNLDPNQLTYVRPKTYSDSWLTTASWFQAAAGRMMDFRPLNTRMVSDLNNLEWNDRLIVIGTPAEQPVMADLALPFPVKNGQILDGNNAPLPGDVGVLMLATTEDDGIPVLVATGNSAEGVRKAVQFLVQSKDAQIGTGQALTVTNIEATAAPDPRDWPGYLPASDRFQLRDLLNANHQPFEDVTVRGTNAPPIVIPFKALPDDRFSRGSRMELEYSYSSGVDPRTSTVEVQLDGVTIGSKRLTSGRGGRETLSVDLPNNLLTPESKLNVTFNLNPRQLELCGISMDQQLYGTVHSDTSFDLKRNIVTHLPDLKLLRAGYPFASPQDLSQMVVAMPDTPKEADIQTLMAFSERMGRLSRADNVGFEVYRASSVPAEARDRHHLVGIGNRDRFPLPEALESNSGFGLGNFSLRQWNQSRVQSIPDREGVVKMVLSPWNSDRVVLALTAQSDQGLNNISELLDRDQLFLQLRGDTTLISNNPNAKSSDTAQAYKLEFLQEAQQKRIERVSFLSRISIFLQDYWFMLPTGIVLLALLMYGVSQLYINRLANSGDVK